MSRFDRRFLRHEGAIPNLSIAAIALAALLPISATAALAGETQAGGALASADTTAAVDCVLPGQIRKLGRSITFVAPSRVVRIGHQACAARGGRPVSG